MNRYRRNVAAGVWLAATAAVGHSAIAQEVVPYEGMSTKEMASLCAKLDDPKLRQRMDGLLTSLLIKCGRSDELGGVESVKYDKDKSTNRVPGTDTLINDPTGESGPTQTQNENSIARSPVTGTLCSGFNDAYSGVVTGQGFTGFARSTDDGATFTDNGAFDPSSSGDPSMIWRQADGNFYLATLRSGGLGIYRSTDDCQTMNFISQASNTGDDKELLAVDNNVGSPHFGRIYLVWVDFGLDNRIYSTFSDDGVNWSSQLAVSDPGVGVQGAWPVVAPDGTVYVAWVGFGGSTIDMQVARSTNGGVSYTRTPNALTAGANPRDLAATNSCGRSALNGNIRYLASPQLAVTPNGDLHITYSYDPDGLDVGDTVDVFYRRSTDQGNTWLPEIRVNDDNTLTDQFFPTISAGPTGRIVVAWYDRRLDTDDNLFVDYYAAMSEDGGASFLPNERISDESSPIYIDPGLATCYHGDYDQQLQTASSAFLQWSDDRAIRSGHNDPDAYLDQNIFEPDFFVSGTDSIASVCAPDDADYNIEVGQSLGFSDPVGLSAAGNPPGTTANFSINPVIPAGSSVLTIGSTASGTPGSYVIDVTGTAGTKSRAAQLTLTLATGEPTASALSMPANGATEQLSQPTFEWTGDAQAAEYVIEIATDPNFINIVDTATTSESSYTGSGNLEPLTTYFWRVTASNACGTGAISATFSFATQNIICVSPALAIPDGIGAGIDSQTSLAAGGILTDLNVSLDVTHTYVGDLIFTLTHDDTGTSAAIVDRPGFTGTGFGCSESNIDATLDDAAALSVEDQCAPGTAIEGTFAPNNPLSVFNGEDLAGTWTMNVSDNAGFDLGTFNEWCLVPALEATGADSDGDGIDDAVDNCTDVANADQRDTNGDGYGNLCDADINNDCIVNAVDLGLLRLRFFTADADADFNGDGVVNVADLGLMRLAFFQPPGPGTGTCEVN